MYRYCCTYLRLMPTIITMHHHHHHHAPPPPSPSTSLPSLIPSGLQVYVLLDLHPIPPSVVGILVKDFIDLYVLPSKGLSLLPASVLPGKGLSLSPPQNPKAILIENRDVYMINPCSANISFVVELCETVSVRSLRGGMFGAVLFHTKELQGVYQ